MNFKNLTIISPNGPDFFDVQMTLHVDNVKNMLLQQSLQVEHPPNFVDHHEIVPVAQALPEVAPKLVKARTRKMLPDEKAEYESWDAKLLKKRKDCCGNHALIFMRLYGQCYQYGETVRWVCDECFKVHLKKDAESFHCIVCDFYDLCKKCYAKTENAEKPKKSRKQK